jgi:hypothetical protein
MRKSIRMMALAAVLTAGCSRAPEVTGSWSAAYPGTAIRAIALGENGRGWWVDQERHLERFTYTVDYDRDPVRLDLLLVEGNRPVRGIVQVIDERSLRLRLASGSDPRPREFSPEEPGDLYYRQSER